MQSAPAVTATFSARCGNSPKALKARDIALGLFGVGELDQAMLSDAATWQRGETLLIGHEAIFSSLGAENTQKVHIEEIVTHGKAAAISGRLFKTDDTIALFCHMVRFSTAAAKQIVSIVSFEHPLKDRPS